MKTFEALQAQWQSAPALPKNRGTIGLIVARTGDGEHEVLERGVLDTERGLVGDRWQHGDAPEPERQVTLMTERAARLVVDGDHPLHMPGDNFLVDLDLSEANLPAGQQLQIGSATLEVSEAPHLGCAKFNERFGAGALKWVNVKDLRPLRLRGVNCRIITSGAVAPGDAVTVLR